MSCKNRLDKHVSICSPLQQIDTAVHASYVWKFHWKSHAVDQINPNPRLLTRRRLHSWRWSVTSICWLCTQLAPMYRRLTRTDFWPRNGLQQKFKNVIYGKETYVGWGVRASGRWSMATQPPFLSKIAMNDHFQRHWRLTPTDFWPRNGLHHKSKNVTYGKETYV
jgi:hypothetical protein